MTIRFDEKPTSRSTTYEPPSCSYLYTLAGTIDHGIAWSYAASMTSPMIIAAGQVLYRQDVKLDPIGYDIWDVTIPYGKLDKTVGSYRFAFSTTGGTVNIKQAKAHVATFPNQAENCKGAIDYDGTNINGTEIVIPALKLTYTFRHPLGYVSEALAVKLARLTGKTNSATWHGFKAGEALFLGASGSDGTDADAEVSYEVACSEELTNATIGAITGVNKKGWDISWNSFEDAPASGLPIRQTKYISVERVYDSFAFASELGF